MVVLLHSKLLHSKLNFLRVQVKRKTERLCFHFDKDERLKADCNLYTHPQVSTVTYLSSKGAPTVIVKQEIDSTGNIDCSTKHASAEVSFPEFNKHLAFDGKPFLFVNVEQN